MGGTCFLNFSCERKCKKRGGGGSKMSSVSMLGALHCGTTNQLGVMGRTAHRVSAGIRKSQQECLSK